MTLDTSRKWLMIARLKLDALLPDTQTNTEQDFSLATTRQETSKATKSTSVESQRLVVLLAEIQVIPLSVMLMNQSIPIKSTENYVNFQEALKC